MAHNQPNEEIYVLFQDAWECWYCGRNSSDCLHHIVGRGKHDSEIEGSTLNLAPLCNHRCHLPFHGYLRSVEGVQMLLNKTKNYLEKIGYEWTEIDHKFYEKYKTCYSVREGHREKHS